MSALDLEAVEQVAELLDQKCREGSTVYCVGQWGQWGQRGHRFPHSRGPLLGTPDG